MICKGTAQVRKIEDTTVKDINYKAVQLFDKEMNGTSPYIGLLVADRTYERICPNGLTEGQWVDYQFIPKFRPYLCKDGEYGVSVSSYIVQKLEVV